MNKLNTPEKLGFGLYLAMVTLATGLPLLLGFFTPLGFSQLGNPRPGILFWSPLLTVVFVPIILILGEISDRIVLRIFNGASKIAVQSLQTLLTFVVILGCYRLVMTSYQAALIAAVTATLGYLVLSPVINRLEKKAPRSDG
ncbi:hypothetical protein [Paeniglutamicibacter sp. Y32M11]|uniref:hypothetical protein n=1 Tax=Paeniglutamicibacter sp. Y32M11 TaxID=2853258 RepID=UPI001C52BC91|nr:hypothetical protein [Paeniglutamicibacter sp. Y32M11]QXQ11838.1 hypothetical protein KUF55_08200 [Paeniglutamicibacter sp. Y32M11]